MNNGIDIPTFGNGDMTKSVYDTNNNGIVDEAENVPNSLLMHNGSYIGDGTTGLTIDTGLGATQIRAVWIVQSESTAGSTSNPIYTTDVILDDNINGMAIGVTNGGGHRYRTNRITDLGTDGTFTVSDDGSNEHPNENGVVYNYSVLAIEL